MKNTKKGFIVPAIILFVLIITSGSYYLYSQNKNQVKPTLSTTSTVAINSNATTKESDTIEEDSQNIGQFTGYYKGDVIGGCIQMEGQDSGECTNVATSTCDTFVVTDGDKPMVVYFMNLVTIGNTVNHLDYKERLVLNIDMYGIESERKKQIIESNERNQTTITLQKKIQGGRGAGLCGAFVKVI